MKNQKTQAEDESEATLPAPHGSKRRTRNCTIYAVTGVLSGIGVGLHETTATGVMMALVAAASILAVWTFSQD